MKQPDVDLIAPIIKDDPGATRELAAAFSKLSDVLRDIYDNLQVVKVTTTAPTTPEISELGNNIGGNNSDIIVLHHATAGNRKIYYKFQGTIYTIAGA